MKSFASRMVSAVLAWARPRLESRRVPLLAALLAASLSLPSLFAGLATEDWIQKVLIEKGEHTLGHDMDLFGHAPFSSQKVAHRNFEYRVLGWFPWVTDDTFDVSFWRPLASLTHHLDYHLWPRHPLGMHAQSIAWYAALAAAVAALYRRLGDAPWLAGVSALLYAADDAHAHAVGWIINRNGIMATLFGVLALLAHHRSRKEGSWPLALVSAGLLALGLGSAEFGLSILGYFAAHFFVLDRAPVGKRLAGALPWLAVSVAWASLYRHLGHSTRGSGLYVDPVVQPVEYAAGLFERATVLLTGQLGLPYADTWSQAEPYAQGFVAFWAVVFVWFVAWVTWPLLARDRSARFWALGSLLSLPPACATFSEDRLLFFAGIGAMPLVVKFVASAWEGRTEAGPRRLPGLALSGAWLLLHGLVAPALFPHRVLAMQRYESRLGRARDSAYAGASPTSLLVLVNGDDFYFTGMIPQTREARGELRTTRLLTLTGTPGPVDIERTDAQTLTVRRRTGLAPRMFDRIYRDRRHPFRRGESIDLVGVSARLSEVSPWGEPVEATFWFTLPLEAAVYDFRVLREGRYERFVLPRVGERVTVTGR